MCMCGSGGCGNRDVVSSRSEEGRSDSSYSQYVSWLFITMGY